jgi:hypothetical protein
VLVKFFKKEMDALDPKIEEHQLATMGNQGEPTALDIIRTETVLSKLPIHNLAKKGRVDIRIIRTTPTGAVELKWEVSYNERYGQARQLAYKLDTIIINRRIDEKGRPLPEIIRIGSLNEICEELGSQKNELKRALQQNATTAINAKLMYKGHDGTERQLEALFTRYSVIFTGEKLPSGKKADAVYIILNKPYREVLDNAPVRPLDREYMKQLPPAAQRFYEIISYRIFSALKYNHSHAKLAYSEYCTFSAQRRSLDWEFVRSQMYQVHQPHVKSGYLVKPIRHDKTTDGEGNLDWVFYYTPGPKARAEFAAAHRGRKNTTTEIEATDANRKMPRRPWQARPKLSPSSQQPDAVNADLLSALVKRGVTENQAREHLANIPATYPLVDTLEWADAEIAKNPSKWDNPAGWYASLVKSRFIPPPTYETRTHREARLAAERNRQEAWEAEQERLAAEEQAEEQKLDDLQAGYPERYQALFRQCEDALHREFPSMMRFGKPDSSLHVGSIRSRMKRLLREQPATEQGSDPVSFLKPVAVLRSSPMTPDDAIPETIASMAGEPAAEQQPEAVASDPPQAEDGGVAAQPSPTPTDPSVEPAAGTTPAAVPIHSIFIETSSAPAEPTPVPANEESAALTTPQPEPATAAPGLELVAKPPEMEHEMDSIDALAA